MGGEVGVESEYGQGSTFWFTARVGKTGRQRRELLPDPDLRGRRVLVVDDHEYAGEVICTQLKSMSFLTTSAASGAAALKEVSQAAAENRPYEIVFLDWQMPGMDGIETARQLQALGLANLPHIAMLTSFGRDELMLQARQVGIEQILVKPVTPSDLFDVAIQLLGGERCQTRQIQPASSLVPEQLSNIQGARILLVEDNELNQQVAVELLKEVGLSADVAENGEVAVRMVQEAAYDIVLMDMQMPVMDGISATQTIRELPRFADLPIVAMTANAMQSDRERCLQAGMNDHLGKPIEPDELWAVLRKWIKPREFSVPAQAGKKTAAGTAIASIPTDIEGLDTTTGLRRMAGKRELYVLMLQKFISSQQSVPEQIQTALNANDLITAERLAHTLKGLAGNIGALSLQNQAEQLEFAVHGNETGEKLNAILTAMAQELGCLITALESWFASLGNTNAQTEEIDQEKLRSVILALGKLLADDDAESTDYLTEHDKLLFGRR